MAGAACMVIFLLLALIASAVISLATAKKRLSVLTLEPVEWIEKRGKTAPLQRDGWDLSITRSGSTAAERTIRIPRTGGTRPMSVNVTVRKTLAAFIGLGRGREVVLLLGRANGDEAALEFTAAVQDELLADLAPQLRQALDLPVR